MITMHAPRIHRMIAAMLLAVGLACENHVAKAQNNLYGINDSLYHIFTIIEKNKNSEESFRLTNTLLKESRTKDDHKAECMALSLMLHHYMYKRNDKMVSETSDILIETAQRYGLTQYHYFALNNELIYQLNNNHSINAQNLAKELKELAYQKNDTYGIYSSMKAFGYICQARENAYLACKHFEEAIDYCRKNLPYQDPSPQICFVANYHCQRQHFKLAIQYLNIGESMAKSDITKYQITTEKAVTMLMAGEMEEYEKAYRTARMMETEKKVGPMYFDKRMDITRSIADGKLATAHNQIDTLLNLTEKWRWHSNVYLQEGNYMKAYLARIEEKKTKDSLVKNVLKSDQSELDIYNGNNTIRLKNIELETENARINLERNKAQGMLNRTKNQNLELEHKKNQLQQNQLETEVRLQKSTSERHKASLEAQEARAQVRNISMTITLIVCLTTLLFIIFYKRTRNRIIRQISAQNDRLILARNKAMQSERMKTTFIQNMSHEIRTPLNAISGFVQLLLDPDIPLEKEEKTQFCNIIMQNSELLTTLINDILTLSEIESEQYTFSNTHVKANSLCRLSIETVRHRLKKGVRLNFETEADDDFTLNTDEKRIRQVLINMLTNALKYTEKGHVTLKLSLTEEADHIVFAVEDTGTGIPEDKRETIFGRFEKLDSQHQGTGLGLNICRVIADKLGGKIYVDGSYKAGARFVFALKRTALTLLLSLGLGTASLQAQNNPYKIKDNLYEYYTKVDFNRNNPLCITMADTLFKMSEEQGDKKAQCLAYSIPTYYALHQNDVETMKVYCDRLRKISKTNGYLQYYYQAYLQEATILIQNFKYEEAILLAQSAYKESQSDKYPYGVLTSLRILSKLAVRLANRDMQLKYCMEGIEYGKKHAPDQDQSQFYDMAVNVLDHLNKREEALALAEEGIRNAKQERNLQCLLRSKCSLLYALNRTEEADQLYEKCLAYTNSINDPQLICELSVRHYICHNMMDKAMEETMKIDDYITRLEQQSLIHKARGDYKMAFQCLQNQMQISDSMRTEYTNANLSHLVAVQTHGELERRMKELELENVKNELAQTEWEKNQELANQENAFIQLVNDSLVLERLRKMQRIVEMDRDSKELQHMRMNEKNRFYTIATTGGTLLLVVVIAYATIILIRTRRHLKVMKQKNAELAEEMQKAEESEKAKSAFIRNMSHEIRTPLNAIVGFIDIITKDEESLTDKEKNDFRAIILHNTELLTKMVNDILFLSSIESGKRKVEIETLRCKDLCTDTMNLLENIRGNNISNVRTACTVNEDVTVTTDKEMLKAVLTQFLENALKYAPESDIILQCNDKEVEGFITFAVVDHGPGIPEEKHQAIFRRFEKIDTFQQGVGLGLSICAAIAKRLNVLIGIDTTYHKGARFYVRVPC